MTNEKPKQTRNKVLNYDTMIKLRLSTNDALKLKQYAQKNNVSASTLIRNFIKTLD